MSYTEGIGWRYRVDFIIHDYKRGTQSQETMSCDALGELREFVDSIIHVLEGYEEGSNE